MDDVTAMAATRTRFEWAEEILSEFPRKDTARTLKFDKTNLMYTSATTKRRGQDTGGNYAPVMAYSLPPPMWPAGPTAMADRPTPLPYSQVANNPGMAMDPNAKLNFTIAKLDKLEGMAVHIENISQKLNFACEKIETYEVKFAATDDRVTRAEYKLLDLEARSRRNNLVFNKIADPIEETWDECEARLVDFISREMKLGEGAKNIVFHRVHRLGKPRRGRGSNGCPFPPRPIIAGFRDFKDHEMVLKYAQNLKGTQYSVNQDFPAEIRNARGRLWTEFCKARAEGHRASIVYLARLVVNGHTVRDEFPGWSSWLDPITNPGDGFQQHVQQHALPQPISHYSRPLPDQHGSLTQHATLPLPAQQGTRPLPDLHDTLPPSAQQNTMAPHAQHVTAPQPYTNRNHRTTTGTAPCLMGPLVLTLAGIRQHRHRQTCTCSRAQTRIPTSGKILRCSSPRSSSPILHHTTEPQCAFPHPWPGIPFRKQMTVQPTRIIWTLASLEPPMPLRVCPPGPHARQDPPAESHAIEEPAPSSQVRENPHPAPGNPSTPLHPAVQRV